MTRVRKLRNRGTVESHGQVAARLVNTGDYVVVHRGVARSFVALCPDGCGELLTINLDPRSGKAWRLDMPSDRATLYPSVWRQEGCRSHFIVWRDNVFWCDVFDEVGPSIEEAAVTDILQELEKAAGRFIHYEHLAKATSLHPWEALWAAQALRMRGLASVKEDSYFAVTAKHAPKRGELWA